MNDVLFYRADKEKQTLIIEIDSLTSALDGSNKARVIIKDLLIYVLSYSQQTA
jgi:hypothetical protein